MKRRNRTLKIQIRSLETRAASRGTPSTLFPCTAEPPFCVLLLDKMKLSKSLHFDRKNLRFQGFTNLGKYTPEHQKSKKGDHALVLMFQPFLGKWVQSLACFLSKGCASGVILHKILMECIVLTEQCGLYVDVIASDGATWNRSMWEKFGVTEEKVHVEHIFDPTRRLWFMSDFPHLIKNTRNFLTKYRIHDGIWTPDGIVQIRHWDALLKSKIPQVSI
ncbi:uncharacterized protein [Temnothorax nylanderi]|uniref:uncharacterized protein n=1 Tax=Temnothorax nylanderi TaxID=102681 RepID=UPI003A867E6E